MEPTSNWKLWGDSFPCCTWGIFSMCWVSFWWFVGEHGNSAGLLQPVIDEEGSRCNWVILNTEEPNVNSTLQCCSLLVDVNTGIHHGSPSFALSYLVRITWWMRMGISRRSDETFQFLPDTGLSLPSLGKLWFSPSSVRITGLQTSEDCRHLEAEE